MSLDTHSSSDHDGARFDHTQHARWMLAALVIPAAGLLVAAAVTTRHNDVEAAFSLGLLGAVGLALLVAAVLFYKLRVTVKSATLTARFGLFGWPRKTVDLTRVVATRPIRNLWWHGWGIHGVGKRTMLYNVAGWQSLELELDSGSRVRIGTDRPHELAAAVAAAHTV